MSGAASRLPSSVLGRPLQQVFNTELNSLLNTCYARSPNTPSKLALAVSGGVDSMALCSLAASWRNFNPKYSLYGFIVDHGLRPESRQEALDTSQRLIQLGIKAQILELKMQAMPGVPFEARARDSRRECLVSACKNIGSPPLLLAHTLDDQVETFLMRAVKNSGWIGLAGTRPLIQWPQRYLKDIEPPPVWLVRPMLKMTKLNNYEICKSRGVQWAEDMSNFDPTATERNAVRAFLAHPAVSSTTLKRAIECTVQAYSDYLENAQVLANTACMELENQFDSDLIIIPDSLLSSLDPHVQELVVLRCAAMLTPKSPTTLAYHRTTVIKAFYEVRNQAVAAATAVSLKITQLPAGIGMERANPRRGELHAWEFYPICASWSQWYLLDGRFYARWKCPESQSHGTHVKLAFAGLTKHDENMLSKLTLNMPGLQRGERRLQPGRAFSAACKVHLQMRWVGDDMLIGYPTLGIFSGVEVEVRRAFRAD